MKKHNKAFEILNRINMGWNLGNYLDTTDREYKIGMSSNKTVEEVVKLWKNPIFNLQCVDSLKELGINCIRLPVTWCNFIFCKNENIKINQDAIKHIKEIIDYCFSRNVIVILDMHHDDQNWLTVACSNKQFKIIKNHFAKVWEIIAYQFKDYDNNLIFEGMNEIVDRTNKEHHDWMGNKKIFFKRLNKLYSVFIKAVRQFSANNKERTLMISTYGAQIHYRALKYFKMPKDKNTIVDMHYYSKHNEMEHFEDKFKYVFVKFTSKNIPIILAEIGTKKEAVNNFSVLNTYLDFAKKYNLKCVLWDNGSSRAFIDRANGKFTHAEMKDYLK